MRQKEYIPGDMFCAVQECSAGNGEVGEMWLETALFTAKTPICDIWTWARTKSGSGGRLIITIVDPAIDGDSQ